ncbi:MAG TPA: AAA family ATPase [Planctomycetota bacterium]|jgi:MoxR-like ATPase|nr:AAA family ATPase [Planctomycetota bacterium]
MTETIDRVLTQLQGLILGKERAVRLAVCCLLARGHLLIEDIPGVGKTTLANGLAKLLGLQLKRVQFTSDLLPADILGNAIFDREKQRFVFHAGAIFAQVVLADEINRASPKTQSALLEAMEERQVTVDGERHPLPDPFFVIATQNPQHQIGTFPLPESQLDRFLMRLDLGYPDREAERAMLAGPERRSLLDHLQPQLSLQQLAELQEHVTRIHVAPALTDYLLDLLSYTRSEASPGLGLSPRAGIALRRAAQAWALMAGRDLVIPEDVQAVAPSVMAHRLRGAGVHQGDGRALAEAVLRAVAVP